MVAPGKWNEGWVMSRVASSRFEVALIGVAVLGLAVAAPASAQKMPKTATPKLFEEVVN
jgi:hypothetical protein